MKLAQLVVLKSAKKRHVENSTAVSLSRNPELVIITGLVVSSFISKPFSVYRTIAGGWWV